MINAWCFYSDDTSWSQHARSFLLALDRLEEVAVIARGQSPVPRSMWNLVQRGRTSDARRPGLGIGPFELMRHVRGTPRIGWVVWETTRLPEPKAAIARELDEVWTPSSWGRQLLIDHGVDEARVHVVPEGVDTELFRPSCGVFGGGAGFSLPAGGLKPAAPRNGRSTGDDENAPFRFLSVGRWTVRKGTDDLVRAYCAEFAPDEPVELVLHGWCPYQPRFDLAARIDQVVPAPHARIVPSMPLSSEELVELYQSCDAFVLPTRGEGWGLPLVEAMACGLPVIATDYSAPADYLDESIAYPLRVEELIDVDEPLFFPRGCGQWAQPDLAHLRALMRHVFEHREEARAKGLRAAQVMRERWTWDHAAAKAHALLERYR